jgi:hypothetical protein
MTDVTVTDVSTTEAAVIEATAAEAAASPAVDDRPRETHDGGSQPRDVFLVCNTIDEVGGVQRWARRMAELFTERGHRVHLVGVFAVAKPHDFFPGGERPAYDTTVLHPDRFGAPGRPYLVRRLTHPTVFFKYRRWLKIRQAGVDRLSALFARSPASGVVVCAQIQAMSRTPRAARPPATGGCAGTTRAWPGSCR